MGNRKQNLKKSLSVSEYPWSSDDEEDRARPSEEITIREPRPSVADQLGTSGAQSQSEQTAPTTSRRGQAQLDRDLFWSIINNTPRPIGRYYNTRSRASNPSLASTLRSAPSQPRPPPARSVPDSDLVRLPDNRTIRRRHIADDVHRILAFKKLTRTLHNLAQNRANISSSNFSNRPPSSHSTPRVLRPVQRSPQRAPGLNLALSNESRESLTRRSVPDMPSLLRPYQGPPQRAVEANFVLSNGRESPDRNSGPDLPMNILRPVQRSPQRAPGPNFVLSDESRESPTRRSVPDMPSLLRPYQGPPQRAVGANFVLSNGRESPDRSSGPDQPMNNPVEPRDSWHFLSGVIHSNGTPVAGQSRNTSQTPPFVHVVDHSEDELQAVEPRTVQPMEASHETEEEEIPRNDTMDAALNDNGSGARLIEEVVEVEDPDEPDSNPPAPAAEANEEIAEPVAENNNNAGAANTEENAEIVQSGSSTHGVKRKRDSPDVTREPFSVQDFNQSLLRLLECPVCLEWMEPPISQCRRGHLVCSRCRARLTACPVCRTPFSSVRNRAMEGVAEMLRYPCRHGCGREVRLRARGPHEASCSSRRYACPVPACARRPALPHQDLPHHFQNSHPTIFKVGCKHRFSTKVNSEQHDTWIIKALDEFFHLRVDIDVRTWGVIIYVAYIGPKRNANSYMYQVTVEGQHNSRRLVYTRATHSDLESSSVNVSRQDCFHLTLDQALNFIRINNRHCEPDKYLDFDIQISKWQCVDEIRYDSDS